MADDSPVALVTGSGIRVGRAIALALGARGYRVWIHYRSSRGPADQVAAELGVCGLGPVGADLADTAERAALVQAVTDPAGPAGGRLDLLVNSAASFESGPFGQRNDDDLRRVLETNLVAPMSLARGLTAALAAAGGCIVNIVDVAAMEAWRGHVDHCVAKAGLAMATRVLAVELAPVRVNGIAPGTVLWPEGAKWAPGAPAREKILAGIPLGRTGTPADVAAAVLFFAAANYVTGQVLAVDGGHLAASGGHPRPVD